MASASWYGPGILGLVSSTAARRVDWAADTIKVSLHTSSYTPDPDAHDFFNDTNNEVSGGGYSRQTLTTSAPSLDTTTNTIALKASATTFSSLTATFRYAVVWKDTGSTATSPLLGYVDFGTLSVPGTNFVITWNSTDGVLKAVYS